MAIRKNFLLDDEIVEHLKKIAQNENTTQTGVIKNLIEEKYKEISTKEKLEAFHNIMKSVKSSKPNQFLEQYSQDDTKILQQVKGMQV